MNIKHIITASAAAGVVLLSTAAAFAQPGVATGAVNVRTGPGTSYSKVGTLSAGEYVDVKDCKGSWCFVDRAGHTDGWVSANYLKPTAAPAPTIRARSSASAPAKAIRLSLAAGMTPSPPSASLAAPRSMSASTIGTAAPAPPSRRTSLTSAPTMT